MRPNNGQHATITPRAQRSQAHLGFPPIAFKLYFYPLNKREIMPDTGNLVNYPGLVSHGSWKRAGNPQFTKLAQSLTTS